MVRLFTNRAAEIRMGSCKIHPLSRREANSLVPRGASRAFEFEDDRGSRGYGFFKSTKPMDRMAEGNYVARIRPPSAMRGPLIIALEKFLARTSPTLVVYPGVLEVDFQTLLGETYGLASYARQYKAHFMMVGGFDVREIRETLLHYPRKVRP